MFSSWTSASKSALTFAIAKSVYLKNSSGASTTAIAAKRTGFAAGLP